MSVRWKPPASSWPPKMVWGRIWLGRYLLIGSLSLWLFAGCGSCSGQNASEETAPEESVETEEREEATEEAPAPEGPASIGDASLRGVVRLAEGEDEVPAFTPGEIGMGSGGTARPEHCPPPRRSDRRPVQMGEGRGLSGILVSISRDQPFETLPAAQPTRRQISIRECRLQPAFIVARMGDALVLKNEDQHPFMPRVRNDPFMQALLPGQERTIQLEAGGRMVDIQCAMTASCGRADLVVLGHPFFALTDEEGRFEIEGLPEGEYRVHAWHPLFRQVQQTATASGSPSETVLEIQGRPTPTAASSEANDTQGSSETPASESAAE